MTGSIKLVIGRTLLSLIAVFTMVSPFLADWNATHIFNTLWPPHAKFHNAQTMSLAVLLGLSGLFFLWRRRGPAPDLLPAVLLISLYWVSQFPAFLFPGVAWTDPNLLMPGQSLTDVPIQLELDAVLLPLIALATWLVSPTRSQRAAP